MKRFQMILIQMILILMILLSFNTLIIAQEKSWLDASQSSKGVIHVKYDKNTSQRIKLMIEKDKQKYTYDVMKRGSIESFPLQLGDGKYKITLLENTEGKKYKIIGSETIEVELNGTNITYLNSVQNIDWSEDSKAIQNAVKITQSTNDVVKKAQILYEDLVYKYAYDYQKLAKLPTTYLPVIDETFRVKTGICYDFSSLYAAMLRSQGIPCKLVKGYSTNAEGYHAWNEVYDSKSKSWQIIDTTYDLQVIKKKPKVSKIKATKDYDKVYEY